MSLKKFLFSVFDIVLVSLIVGFMIAIALRELGVIEFSLPYVGF